LSIEYGRLFPVSMILVALFLFVPLLLAVSRLDAIAAVPLALLPVMQGSQLLGGHLPLL
jgi:hypothetical protein